MSSPHPRLPLVLSATLAATEQAQRLLPAGAPAIETLVHRAIAASRVHSEPKVGGTTTVFVPQHGLVVVVERTLSPLTNRRAWRPLAVRRDPRGPAAFHARREDPGREENR
jgi:hypothetical protein